MVLFCYYFQMGGMKKFPSNPENYNPVQLIHQMSPGIKFNDVSVSCSSNPALFESTCELNSSVFIGQGNILLTNSTS